MTRPPILAVGLCIALLGFSSSGNDSQAEPPDNVIVVGTGGDIGSLDLALGLRMPPSTIIMPIYETLVETVYNAETGKTETVPGIAHSWEVSKNGTVWTFKLEPGHRFDDGSELKADSVKFTFDRILGLGRGPASAFSFLERTEIIDHYTVRFVLSSANPLFIPLLGDPIGGIMNLKVMEHERNGDFASAWLSDHPTGSGPYKLARVQPEKFYVLERNPHYAGEAGPIDRVVIQSIPDETVRALQLTKGDLDVALQLSGQALGNIENDPDVVIHSGPADAYLFFVLNTKQGVMANPEVRRAVEFAIDYDATVNVVMKGQAEFMRGPLPADIIGAVPELYPLEFDLDKAGEMLRDASIAPGTTVRIALPQVASSDTGTLALMLQANLSSLGFDARIENLALVTMIDRIERAEFDIVLMGWFATAPDPVGLVNFWMDPDKAGSGGNFAHYDNPEVADLLKRSITIQDAEKRAAMVRNALTIARDDVPYIFVARRHSWAAVHRRVQGYRFFPREYLTVHFNELFKAK